MSSLKNKLYNYEQTPPVLLWEKIAAALDESHIADEFPSKLYNSEAVPPVNTWDKIISLMEAERPAVIPMAKKNFVLFRYAAAAAVIGLIALAIVKWTGGNADKSGTETIASKDSTNDNKAPAVTDERNSTNNDPNKENTITEDNIAGIIANDQVKKTRQRKINNYPVPDIADAAEPIYAVNEHAPNLADRYIMLMTPNGDIIRMSKKWGNLVCCVSGQEQDEDCKDQLKKWQEKLATSPASSTGNFMDILSLVSSLNDNEL